MLRLKKNRIFVQQQPVTEGYQYNQLSPSRSPNGPTYTQLNTGIRQNAAASYHNAGASANAGMLRF